MKMFLYAIFTRIAEVGETIQAGTRQAGYALLTRKYPLLTQPLAVPVTSAQTRDVRCTTAWYDIGIAPLE